MKVVCPECAHETDVPDDVLGDRGKRVRCAQCKHIWFQEPVVEATDFGKFRRFDESLDIEPIPQSVHPDADDHSNDDDDDEDSEKSPSFFSTLNYAYLGRMVAGFVLGCLLIGGGLMGAAKAGVTPKILSPFYAALGIEAHGTSPFEIKDVKIDGKNLSGWIVNTSAADAHVPSLEVTPVDADGVSSEGMRIAPEQETLQPKEGLEFKAELQSLPPEGGKLTINFVD
ncbi:MAG: hypothetical protein EBQ96_04345 [Proteobacteria bacterium]|nr:hypothetical protein [Pseudomonadota bacterium]